jgi:hypothetical protein
MSEGPVTPALAPPPAALQPILAALARPEDRDGLAQACATIQTLAAPASPLNALLAQALLPSLVVALVYHSKLSGDAALIGGASGLQAASALAGVCTAVAACVVLPQTSPSSVGPASGSLSGRGSSSSSGALSPRSLDSPSTTTTPRLLLSPRVGVSAAAIAAETWDTLLTSCRVVPALLGALSALGFASVAVAEAGSSAILRAVSASTATGVGCGVAAEVQLGMGVLLRLLDAHPASEAVAASVCGIMAVLPPVRPRQTAPQTDPTAVAADAVPGQAARPVLEHLAAILARHDAACSQAVAERACSALSRALASSDALGTVDAPASVALLLEETGCIRQIMHVLARGAASAAVTEAALRVAALSIDAAASAAAGTTREERGGSVPREGSAIPAHANGTAAVASLRSAWAHAGLAKCAVEALGRHRHHAGVVQAACASLASACPTYAFSVADSAVLVARAAGVLVQHESSLRAVSAACDVLIVLSRGAADAAASTPTASSVAAAATSALVRAGVVTPLVQLLVRHAYSPELISRACCVLSVIIVAAPAASKTEACHAGVIAALSTILTRFLAAPAVMAPTLDLLRELVSDHADCQEDVLSSKGTVANLKAAVVRHKGTPAGTHAAAVLFALSKGV